MMSEEEKYDLPLDISIEIFKKLPIKSLIRFTSVSKEWKSVIRSSQFISDYNNIQQQQQASSNHFFVGSDHRKNYAIIKNKQTIQISGDFIGFKKLLTLPQSDDNFRDFDSCCKLIDYSQGLFGFHNNNDRLLIYNPSIRKSVFIPLPRDCTRACDFCFTVISNATEPTVFYTTMLMVFTTTKEPRLRVQIYTLSTGAWRTVSDYNPRASLWFTAGQQEVTDRFIYWITFDWNHNDDSSIYVILSFDITSEQFRELCLPPNTSGTDLHLSKVRESLVVLETNERKTEMNVWMMELGGVENSFTKQFTVNLLLLPPTFLL